jgi:homoaconitase/3-isopropylmalate dehydratase large subunit
MGKNMVQKIMEAHLVSGRLNHGDEVGITVDHILIQDTPGTMALLQFEAMEIPRVRTKRSEAYIHHNTLQVGFESMDDMCSSGPLAVSSDCAFPGREMVSSIRSIWNVSRCQGIPFWVRTAIPPPEVG